MRFIIVYVLLLSLVIAIRSYERSSLAFEEADSKEVDPNSSENGHKFCDIPLKNFNNMQYRGEISVGSNGQTFSVVFDTRTNWIWIPGNQTTKKAANNFDCEKSNTCIRENIPVRLTYGKGVVKGLTIIDTVKFGATSNFYAKNQTMMLASSNIGLGLFSNGVCGLGISSNSATFLDTLKAQKMINEKVFSLYLDDNAYSWGTPSSELRIGGINKARLHDNQLEYVKLASNDSWEVELTDFKMGAKSLIDYHNKTMHESSSLGDANPDRVQGQYGPVKYTAIINLMRENLALPSSAISAIVQTLEQDYTITCIYSGSTLPSCACPSNSKDDFPDITLVLGQTTLNLSPSFYVHEKSRSCDLMFETLDSNDNQTTWVLGNTFLRAFYTVFDEEQKRIGFSHAFHSKSGRLDFWSLLYVATAFIILILIISFFVMVARILIKNRGQRTDSENDVTLPIISINDQKA